MSGHTSLEPNLHKFSLSLPASPPRTQSRKLNVSVQADTWHTTFCRCQRGTSATWAKLVSRLRPKTIVLITCDCTVYIITALYSVLDLSGEGINPSGASQPPKFSLTPTGLVKKSKIHCWPPLVLPQIEYSEVRLDQCCTTFISCQCDKG